MGICVEMLDVPAGCAMKHFLGGGGVQPPNTIYVKGIEKIICIDPIYVEVVQLHCLPEGTSVNSVFSTRSENSDTPFIMRVYEKIYFQS